MTRKRKPEKTETKSAARAEQDAGAKKERRAPAPLSQMRSSSSRAVDKLG